MRKIAKTSSGSVFDKGELIFRDDEEAEAILEDNPFEIDDDVMEEDLDEDEEDEEDEDHSVNPFDDLD